MTNQINIGQLVLAKVSLVAIHLNAPETERMFQSGLIVGGHEINLPERTSGRVVKVSDDGCLLVNWRRQCGLYSWVFPYAIELAETMTYKNVTIYFKSDFFGVSSIYCKTLRIEKAPYAQYKEATYLRFRQPRQRKDRYHVLFDDQQMVIVKGQAEPFQNFKEHTESIVKGKYSAFSPSWGFKLSEHARNAGEVLYIQDKQGNKEEK